MYQPVRCLGQRSLHSKVVVHKPKRPTALPGPLNVGKNAPYTPGGAHAVSAIGVASFTVVVVVVVRAMSASVYNRHCWPISLWRHRGGWRRVRRSGRRRRSPNRGRRPGAEWKRRRRESSLASSGRVLGRRAAACRHNTLARQTDTAAAQRTSVHTSRWRRRCRDNTPHCCRIVVDVMPLSGVTRHVISSRPPDVADSISRLDYLWLNIRGVFQCSDVGLMLPEPAA